MISHTRKRYSFTAPMVLAATATTGATATGTVYAMAYTSSEVLAILAGIGSLITVIIGGAVLIIKAVRETAKVTETAIVKVAAVADTIEGHVNSATTKSETIIAAQETQLTLQRETITELKRTAALLASAQASTDAIRAAATGHPAEPLAAAAPTESLGTTEEPPWRFRAPPPDKKPKSKK